MSEKKTYKIEITETMQRTVTVQARDKAEAVEIAAALWENSSIILGAEDFTDVDFKPIDE